MINNDVMEIEGDADTLLIQITRDNPSKPDQTQQNSQKSGGYVVLSEVISRSKELKIPRSLRARRFKSGPGDHKIGAEKQGFMLLYIKLL